ncbi:signal peptidase I [Ruminococcus sp.]|uniref:signal peptidase I n=1 Tax=Ruminococcus sp. TaxID=41978 RepID=UPI0025D441D2|nr:signal peptidase I [Ruminococcus sp.]
MFSKSNRALIYKVVLGLIVLFFIIFHFNFKIIVVKGSSMAPTYHDKEILIAARNTENILTNSVIIFCDNTNTVCIKRVIAKPGDTVSLKKNNVQVNNYQISNIQYEGKEIVYKLKKDEYYVVGDNSKNSYDSREYGPIKLDQIKGVIL